MWEGDDEEPDEDRLSGVPGPRRGHVWNIPGEGATPFGAAFGHTIGEPGSAGWVRHRAGGEPWFDAG